MEKIKKLNLEISLFIKELNSYTQNVNEIDDETIKLLTETILAVNKLQINSKYREASTTNENNFVHNLNDDIFRCRRNIVCCLCHDTIPLNSEDFEAHIQKYSHKEKEIELRTVCQNGNGTHMLRKTSVISVNSTNSTNGSQSPYLTTASSTSLANKIAYEGIEDRARENTSDIVTSTTSTDISPNIPPNQVPTTKLADVIKIEHILETTTTGAFDLMTRMETRIKNESKILSLLTRYLKAFDSTLEAISFGSATYGFGGSKTNFNILVNAGRSERHPIVVLNSFERSLKLPTTQGDFEVLDSIIGDRVQTKRLQVIHIESGILCWIQCGINFELAASSQVIRDCNINEPLCYHMIAHIRSWQNALNDVAAQNGLSAFQFNTYIISVLIIFFLQVNRNFPKLKNLPSTQFKSINHVPIIDKKLFMQMVHEFFEFYGEKYVISNHVISVNIGRWQELQLNSQQVNLTPEQNSLRDGIESNAFNWKNCTMYVQDIKSPGKNIAAEISSEEAYKFKHMCQVFSHSSCETSTAVENSKDIVNVDDNNSGDFIDIASTSAGAKNNIPSFSVNSNTLPVRQFEDSNKVEEVFQSIKTEIAKHMPKIDIDCSSLTSKVKNEQNTNKDDDIILKINKGIADSRISHLLASRSRFELEIVSIFSQYIQKMESSLKLYTFGSTQYGINDSNTNFNLLITTGRENAKEMSQKFFFFSPERTDIDLHFKDIHKIGANRVLRRQISMTHIKSGIKCLILFERDNVITQSSQIINRYNENPICIFLISYIRMWQIVLKQSGSIRFQFNTYIISILVIFFLQMNHNFPTVEQLLFNNLEIKSNISNFKPVVREFFAFYGNRYQIWNHVISVHIGRWQERRIQPSQTSFSPVQQRLRKGMEMSPENWTNCTMFVQDLMRPDVNITAEISKDAADHFQQKCQEFAKKLS